MQVGVQLPVKPPTIIVDAKTTSVPKLVSFILFSVRYLIDNTSCTIDMFFRFTVW